MRCVAACFSGDCGVGGSDTIKNMFGFFNFVVFMKLLAKNVCCMMKAQHDRERCDRHAAGSGNSCSQKGEMEPQRTGRFFVRITGYFGFYDVLRYSDRI